MSHVMKVAVPFDRDSTISDIKVYGARLLEIRYIPAYPATPEERRDVGYPEGELHPHGVQLVFEADVKEAWVRVGNTTYKAQEVSEYEERAS